MSIYDELQLVAADVMSEFKQGTVQYVHVTDGTGGTVDEPAAPTETVYNLDAAARGVEYKFVKDGLALSSDLQATFGAYVTHSSTGVRSLFSTIAPVKAQVMKGFVNVDGSRYKIVEFIPVPAAGTAVAYTLIFRK